MRSVGSVGKVWLTCCALNNWLLEVDGYDIPYNRITQSSNPSFSELTMEDIPIALQQLENVSVERIGKFPEMDEGPDATSMSNNNVNNVNVN